MHCFDPKLVNSYPASICFFYYQFLKNLQITILLLFKIYYFNGE